MDRYNVFRVGNPGCRYKKKLHDRALKRALSSTCIFYPDEARPQISTIPRRTLFLYNLSFDTVEDSLKRKFERFGELVCLYIVRDLITGDSKGYGFAEFASSGEAREAYDVSCM
jgi:U11/U12 small nuclear ribonucleoprotein 35 kDa protein